MKTVAIFALFFALFFACAIAGPLPGVVKDEDEGLLEKSKDWVASFFTDDDDNCNDDAKSDYYFLSDEIDTNGNEMVDFMDENGNEYVDVLGADGSETLYEIKPPTLESLEQDKADIQVDCETLQQQVNSAGSSVSPDLTATLADCQADLADINAEIADFVPTTSSK